MGSFGFQEMLVIGFILMVFFGPKKFPELGSGLGTAIRDFKRALSDNPSEGREQIREVQEPSETLPASAAKADIEHPPVSSERV